MNAYFYRDNSGKEIGPLDLDTLAKLRSAGVLNENTSVRSENSAEWKLLRELLPSSSVSNTPQQSSKKSINWTWAGLLVAAVIIIVAWHFNNSSKQTLGNSSVDQGSAQQAAAAFINEVQQKQLQPPASRESDEEARKQCINNLKEIGLAFRIWEGDNGDKYPFNVSTTSGGTMELCDRTFNEFDRNAVFHFRVMSNELGTTKILVCPSDSKQTAVDFAHLQPENISYQLRSGANISDANPHEILAICPIHHVVLYADGSVSQLPTQRTSERSTANTIISNFAQARAASQANACINNLRQIDAAANQFALEHAKRTGDPINFPGDLTPYIKLDKNGKIPSCPAGGIYTINRVGDTPTCSLGNTVNPAHVLP